MRMKEMARVWVGLLALAVASPAIEAASDRVIKVLPHYLDRNGRHALSPSLFERDAYQAELRRAPALRGGLQFDVQWKAKKRPGRALQLRIELVTVNHPKGDPFLVDLDVAPTGTFSRWKRVKLDATLSERLGEIVAWRITLREGSLELSEQKSFLW